MAITTALTDLLSSVYELLASVFGTAYHVVHSLFAAAAGLLAGFFHLVADLVSGAVEVVGGVGKFVVGNFVILGVIAAAGYLYVNYTKQGKAVAKKTN